MKIVFTAHAELRIKRRKVLKEEVIEAIRQPDKTIKKHEKYYYQKKMIRGTIEVVAEKTGSVENLTSFGHYRLAPRWLNGNGASP